MPAPLQITFRNMLPSKAVEQAIEKHMGILGRFSGRIAFLDYANGYGFIETPDGRRIYFHKNSVLDADFDRLDVGELVRFREEAGEEGPQASSVHVDEKFVEAG